MIATEVIEDTDGKYTVLLCGKKKIYLMYREISRTK